MDWEFSDPTQTPCGCGRGILRLGESRGKCTAGYSHWTIRLSVVHKWPSKWHWVVCPLVRQRSYTVFDRSWTWGCWQIAARFGYTYNVAEQFVTGDYERKSSVTAMKSSLDWEILQQRRQVARLTNFHQAVAGRLAIPVRNILHQVERNLCHTSPVSNSFIPIAINKHCHKFSFIPRTIINWNDLPENITSIQDKDQFKQAVNSHLSKQK